MQLTAAEAVFREHRQETRNEKGFTLLELIVVCTLIGILLSLSVPSLRMTFFSDPLKSTARNMIGLVNGVRELAVRQQQPYLLHISQAERRVWYEMEDKTGVEEAGNHRKEQILLPETVNISGVWLGDAEASDEQSGIYISKQGYVQQTRIRIEDEDGEHLFVIFYPFLDSVTVTE
jgi:prepilin-type N-terminal cleavage/methylation domain-containing protein